MNPCQQRASEDAPFRPKFFRVRPRPYAQVAAPLRKSRPGIRKPRRSAVGGSRNRRLRLRYVTTVTAALSSKTLARRM